jgi:hypothetical protein
MLQAQEEILYNIARTQGITSTATSALVRGGLNQFGTMQISNPTYALLKD